MNKVSELLHNVDLAAAGKELLTLIDAVDPYLIAVFLGGLVLLGSRMAAPFPRLRSWGLRLAVAVFLVHLGYVHFSHGIGSGDLPRTLVRSANVAGLVLAPLWLVLPVVLFVYRRIRLALAAFLIYVGYACLASGKVEAGQLPQFALQGLIAAGLAVVVAWILQPVTDFISQHLLARLKKPRAEMIPVEQIRQSPRDQRDVDRTG